MKTFLKTLSLKQFIISTVIATVSLVILNFFFNVIVDRNGIWGYLAYAALLVLINTFLVPLVSYLALRIGVFVTLIINFILNAVSFAIIPLFLPGVDLSITRLMPLIVMAIIYSIILSLITSLLEVRSDYYETLTLAHTLAHRGKELDDDIVPLKENEKGIIFLEIDGLSTETLKYAFEKGWMPNLKKWVNSTHNINNWTADISSQTASSQAGILLGNNKNIPAFRWWDRRYQKEFVSSNSTATIKVEELNMTDHALLKGGVSFNNMFSGGALVSGLTLSRVKHLKGNTQSVRLFALTPSSFATIIANMVIDFFEEIIEAIGQKVINTKPRIFRFGKYTAIRPITTILMKDLSKFRIIDTMLSFSPTIYVTFSGYDEVAHHAGTRSRSAMKVLKRIDTTFESINRVNEHMNFKYEIVVLSDHGQTKGFNFRQKQGVTIEKLILNLCGIEALDHRKHDTESDIAAQIALREVAKIDNKEVTPKEVKQSDTVKVYPSGNLCLIYFPENDKQMSDKEISEKYPDLIDKLITHPGIDFVLVRESKSGWVVKSLSGSYYLANDKVLGKNPLAKYHKHASQLLKRYVSFENVPDIILNGKYDENTDMVQAFEEFVGSHGGLGGEQSNPFLIYPKVFGKLTEDIVGPESINKHLNTWLKIARENKQI